MMEERSLNDLAPDTAPETAGEDGKAKVGAPLAPGATPVGSEEPVIEALKTVFDPEIPVNIYDLGLIYGIDIGSDGSVKVDMTLTAPACPVAGAMPGRVAEAVAGVEGVGEVEVQLVWDPPWTPDKMTDEAKLALNMF